MMTSNFLNYNEASDYLMNITDPVTRELASLVLSTLVHEGLKGNRPEGEFDVLFFIKIVAQALSSHQDVARLLKGESLLWPEPSHEFQPS